MTSISNLKSTSSQTAGFTLLEVISSAAILALAIAFSYSFASISEDIKSSSKLRNSVAEIVENDLEKLKSISWGFLYNPKGLQKNNPCYRTSNLCNQNTPPIAPNIFSMQRWCLDVSPRFISSLPASLKSTYNFFPDNHYHQVFQGRSAQIRRTIQLINHPISSFNSTSYSNHRSELIKISYYLVALNKNSEKIVLENFTSGSRPNIFFIRSYITNLDAHAWCPSLS